MNLIIRRIEKSQLKFIKINVTENFEDQEKAELILLLIKKASTLGKFNILDMLSTTEQ